jgi:hypothetical protein
MAIRGQSKNVIFDPIVYKDLDEHKNLLPTFIDMRNVVLDDRKSINKRPGYTQDRDLGVDKPVNAMIPDGDHGYAITEDGRVFLRTATSKTELTGRKLTGTFRPLHAKYNGTIAIVDGGNPVKIKSGDTATLGTSFRKFRYLALVNQIMVYAGHDDYSFEYSANGNIENISTGDSSGVNGAKTVKKDGKIMNTVSLDNKLFILKDNSIERWHNSSSLIFVRVSEMPVGCSASYSVVKESNTIYWLDENYRFRKMINLSTASPPISTPFDKYIKGLSDFGNVVGHRLDYDDIILWQFGTSGKTLAYDFKHDKWFEWNEWVSGQWQRFPINSYMEINNKRYFGSYNLDGLIYELSEDYLDDNGEPTRYFIHFKVKFSQRDRQTRYNHVKFRLKRAVATATITSPVFEWRYRFDMGAWSNWRQEDLGAVGVHDPYIEAFNFGIGVEMEIEMSMTDATEFKISDFILTGEELGN